MPPTPPARSPRDATGLQFAVGAYLIWGLLPLYLKLLHGIGPVQFVGWRVVFTLPVCLALVTTTRQGWKLAAALRNPRTLALLVLSALLIGGNWLIYVIAVQWGHVIAASIGYYINPLLNVLLGTVFLGETLNRRQWLAVGIAACGVAVLGWGARDTLGISLALAVTFGGYGLVRKLTPVDSLPGLTVESLVLAGPAVLMIWLGGPTAHSAGSMALLSASGVITATPLLLFAAAARRLELSTLGFVQFISPTLQFLLGLLAFHEPLRMAQALCLGLVWVALGVFCVDVWLKRRQGV
ncbi:MAG: EamA family transporter RarD [Sphingomonadales bacterium]|nr:EamA family transporter RarD [Sphingomonadales bacterium]